MDLYEAIRKRHTTNGAFADRPIDPEHKRAILELAARAPSHFNSQPWRFVVVEDLERRTRARPDRRRVDARPDGGWPLLAAVPQLLPPDARGGRGQQGWHPYRQYPVGAEAVRQVYLLRARRGDDEHLPRAERARQRCPQAGRELAACCWASRSRTRSTSPAS